MIRSLNSKPAIVLDASILRSIPRNANPLPGGVWYVVHDVFIREVLTSESAPIRRLADQVRRFVDSNRDQVLVAKYWQDISRNEWHPGFGASRDAVISWSSTEQVRRGALLSVDDMLCEAERLQPEAAGHRSDQAAFVEMMSASTAAIRESAEFSNSTIDEMKNDPNAQVAYIRQPEVVRRWIEALTDQRFQSADWRAALEQFPDVHAIGRWIRLMEWYAMKHVLGYTKKFKNNFEDAQYALSASYLDAIVTTDAGMREAIAAVFPEVQVLSSLSQIPSVRMTA